MYIWIQLNCGNIFFFFFYQLLSKNAGLTSWSTYFHPSDYSCGTQLKDLSQFAGKHAVASLWDGSSLNDFRALFSGHQDTELHL